MFMAVPAGYVMCLSEIIQSVMRKETYFSYVVWGLTPQTNVN